MRRTLWMCAFLSLGATALLASPAEDLHDLFQREWAFRLETNPLMATSVGVHDFNDRLPDVSQEALATAHRTRQEFVQELDAIDLAELSPTDRINAQIFRGQLENALDSFEFGAYQIPFNADSGFYTGFARLPFNVPLQSIGDYENYIARLRAWPGYVDAQIANMRVGLERGMTQPRLILDGIDDTVGSHAVDDPTTSVFYTPFESFPVGVPEEAHERLRNAGKAAIRDAVAPGYGKLRDFMVDEYMPQARQSLGALELPDGAPYYAAQIRRFTTLDLTPEEIHEIGRKEVARIRSEMEAVIEETGFEGSFAEFLEFLRTDPRFYPKSAEELLKEAAYISKRMDGQLPRLFKTLPRLSYTVEPVPDDIAPKYTAGRYVGAPIGSTQPGRYWVNVYALDTRPLYNLEALSLHEAVPGHHFQIALNQELEDIPPFRQHSYISAFGEGWGLYSEWLGLEAGFYTDPYSNFGRLTYEMWRACRLVVDTGVHALGWDRQQMRDFLAENTALSLHEISTETDRYISWPAQALAYKLGELKIKELRRRAETALGEAFDIREFHDAVLLNGSVPLDVLEQVVDGWIQAQTEALGP